jgi:ATP-dependent RNA helicase RhlB
VRVAGDAVYSVCAHTRRVTMKFSELNLHEDLQRGIADAGFVDCMDVQAKVLTNAFSGSDLYVQSQTGTGKTAAYLTLIFQRLLTEPLIHGKKALIMVPTRELAVQVEQEAKMIAKYLPFKVGSFYGGIGYAQQHKMLKDDTQILVGTPGRVLDLNASGTMNLMDIAFLVLDEADRMFDMGFYPDLRKLIRVVPPADRRQTMLFSATLNAYIKNLAWEYTREPVEIEIEPEHVDVVEIKQLLYHVPNADKFKLLLGIFKNNKPESAIIFCNTKRYAEIVAKRLKMNGILCEFIIGDLPQMKRLKIIEDVKSGKNKYLVATDVAARGLDVEGLELVINYDIPNEAENYVHRIGRTGRAGKSGTAITLASEQDVYGLPEIEKYLGKKIPAEYAFEDMFAEDKTEGLRIHTDDYGRGNDRSERSSDRGRRGSAPIRGRTSGPRERTAPTSRRGPETPRTEAGNRDRRPVHSDTPRPSATRAHAPSARPADKRTAKPVSAAPAKQRPIQKAPRSPEQLHRMSLEERLAYYKSKYEQDGGFIPAGPAQDTPSGKNQRGTTQQRRAQPPKGPKPQQENTTSAKPKEKSSGFVSLLKKVFGRK